MRKAFVISFVGFVLFSGCSLLSASNRSNNEAMLNFLPYLNQKVAGYLIRHDVKTLNDQSYKVIVGNVCSPLPSCCKNADAMFNNYSVSARILNGMFSVMLCDGSGRTKIMEDFSCNEEKVEIRNFETDPESKCEFESQWRERIAPYCLKQK